MGELSIWIIPAIGSDKREKRRRRGGLSKAKTVRPPRREGNRARPIGGDSCGGWYDCSGPSIHDAEILSTSGVHCHCTADGGAKGWHLADERRARNSGGGELLPCLFVRLSDTIRANCRAVTGGQFMFTVPYDLTLFIFCDSTRRVELRGVPVKMPQF